MDAPDFVENGVAEVDIAQGASKLLQGLITLLSDEAAIFHLEHGRNLQAHGKPRSTTGGWSNIKICYTSFGWSMERNNSVSMPIVTENVDG